MCHTSFVLLFLCCSFFVVCFSMEIRGMTFTGDRYCPEVTFDSESGEASLRHLATTGCNFVALVVTWYQSSYMSSKVYPLSRPFAGHDPRGTFWRYTYVSETPKSVVRAIRLAHSLGMQVLLKPHVDLINSQGLWRGDIMAVSGWWDSYSKMLLFWARIAQQEGVEMLSVSCELIGVSRDERSWRKVIASVRNVYKGKLTAAANWAPLRGEGELTQKTFWDALDYIGCDEYMKLPTGDSVTVEAIVEAWQPYVAQFRNLSVHFDRPFLLTEVGYCSGANCDPGVHDSPRGHREQAMHYEAVLRVIEQNQPWFKGVFFWNWMTDNAFGESENYRCMDPKWKDAELVLRRYYNATKPQPERDMKAKAKCKCTL